jgi:hypothetical protein
LGGASYTPAALIAAIFRRVLTEAVLQHNKAAPARVILTHPVRWPPNHVEVLATAAHSAARESGVVLPDPEFVAEPVAAAQWYARDNHFEPLQPGQRIAVYDLGGGTFDTTVLERTPDGYEELAKRGIDPLGGYDFDFRLFTHLGDRHIGPANPGLWEALQIPNPDDVDVGWKRRRMQESVELLKWQLSEQTSEDTHLPGVPGTVLVTRSDFEGLIADDVDRTIDELTDTLAEAGLTPKDLTAIYRIGGASRTPLVGQRLEALHVPVRTLGDPKLIVALGASVTPSTQPVTPPKRQPQPKPQPLLEPEPHSQPQPKPQPLLEPEPQPQPEPLKKTADAMGRWAWRSITTGTALLSVATAISAMGWLVFSVPIAAQAVTWAVFAIIGALLVRIGSLTSENAGRGWILSGIILIATVAALLAWRLLVVVLDIAPNLYTAVLGGLTALGVLLVLGPQWSQVPTRGAVVGLITGGVVIVAVDVISVLAANNQCKCSAQVPADYIAIAAGIALVVGGVVARRRRRRLRRMSGTSS